MEPILGMILPFPYGFVPVGWAACNGQVVPITSNTALFALIGTLYGGDGRVTFALPNLNGYPNSPVAAGGVGDGPGLTPRVIGELVGDPTYQLSTSEIPLHNHTASLFNGGATPSATPMADGAVLVTATNGFAAPNTAPSTTFLPQMLLPAGNSEAHDNVQPSMQLLYCIATSGDFPAFG